jgi:hypothetical protein
MSRAFFAAWVLALFARVVVFAEPGTVEAFVSFAVFWACAAGWLVSYVMS